MLYRVPELSTDDHAIVKAVKTMRLGSDNISALIHRFG
jgi:hypothetical protein